MGKKIIIILLLGFYGNVFGQEEKRYKNSVGVDVVQFVLPGVEVFYQRVLNEKSAISVEGSFTSFGNRAVNNRGRIENVDEYDLGVRLAYLRYFGKKSIAPFGFYAGPHVAIERFFSDKKWVSNSVLVGARLGYQYKLLKKSDRLTMDLSLNYNKGIPFYTKVYSKKSSGRAYILIRFGYRF